MRRKGLNRHVSLARFSSFFSALIAFRVENSTQQICLSLTQGAPSAPDRECAYSSTKCEALWGCDNSDLGRWVRTCARQVPAHAHLRNFYVADYETTKVTKLHAVLPAGSLTV